MPLRCDTRRDKAIVRERFSEPSANGFVQVTDSVDVRIGQIHDRTVYALDMTCLGTAETPSDVLDILHAHLGWTGGPSLAELARLASEEDDADWY